MLHLKPDATCDDQRHQHAELTILPAASAGESQSKSIMKFEREGRYDSISSVLYSGKCGLVALIAATHFFESYSPATRVW